MPATTHRSNSALTYPLLAVEFVVMAPLASLAPTSVEKPRRRSIGVTEMERQVSLAHRYGVSVSGVK